MEEDMIWRKIPTTPLMDHEPTVAAAGCRSGLTRSDSDSFPIDVDCSSNLSATIANAPSGASTGWTDEKHKLYLSSLESSFVSELHRYIGLQGYLPAIIWGPDLSRELPPNRCDSSYEARDSDGNEPLLESTADSGIIQGSSRVHHFASSNKQVADASPEPRELTNPCENRIHVKMDLIVPSGFARSTEQPNFCLFHQVVGSAAEVSDQNFPDDVQGEESLILYPCQRG